jgi:tetratricopeptide (TPR) repeat protein
MKPQAPRILLVVLCFSLSLCAQLDKIVIPAGTPEDKALQAITNEQDQAKKLPMYEEFLQTFATNPAAVAYGNWQISQYYQTTGDMEKALEYGDKAVQGSPHNLDILVSQADIAQRVKNNAKVIEYAVRGGATYNSIGKQSKAESLSDQEFAARLEEEKTSSKNSYEFLEAAAYNVIAAESDAKTRMTYIEQYSPAFPGSRFEEQINSYAMVALSELKDMNRLVAFGEKALAANPKSVSTLMLLANAYVDDPKPGSLAKSVEYAQKAIKEAKADAADADRSSRLSAGVAHSTLGYAYMKQDKTAAAVPELKTSADLLKGQDEQQYAIALYRLGYAYAKLSKMTEAREVLAEAVKISGPVQEPAQELLVKVNAIKTKKK